MKFTTVAALLATFAAVASAALPVEPAINGFIIQDDTPSARQQIVIDSDHHKPAQTQGTKSYIVVFKDTAALQVMENVEKEILAFGGKIGQRYSSALKGFSAWIPGPIVTALLANPFINYIEEDREVTAYV
ncbi:hypothetical protein BGZ97_011239 [Linnemannia gamsii]|uniref:Inhibitor I9 domain-containing protein n=1 Tax=Linnemannia gamsii TaxID=64522 RepID=A0A9P6R933_9FUNG|nr:hypothetical protein BGZ97_011239 [Linnemannia gamsii]